MFSLLTGRRDMPPGISPLNGPLEFFMVAVGYILIAHMKTTNVFGYRTMRMSYPVRSGISKYCVSTISMDLAETGPFGTFREPDHVPTHYPLQYS